MPRQDPRHAAAAVAYIEAHLSEPLSLTAVAREVRYSKYHLHRLFAETTGITLYSYIRRRRLTEAARQLTASRQSILDIALLAGYQSQQAFSTAFASMYKRTPADFRRTARFYPLQLPLQLTTLVPAGEEYRLHYAAADDIPDWMALLTQVVDGFPCLVETAHQRQLAETIARKEALILRHGDAVVGAAAFSRQKSSIDFLAAHPQYRCQEVLETLLDHIVRQELSDRRVTITTFRQGDRADPGQRKAYQRLGFGEGERLVQFGYPVQRLILPPWAEVIRHAG